MSDARNLARLRETLRLWDSSEMPVPLDPGIARALLCGAERLAKVRELCEREVDCWPGSSRFAARLLELLNGE